VFCTLKKSDRKSSGEDNARMVTAMSAAASACTDRSMYDGVAFSGRAFRNGGAGALRGAEHQLPVGWSLRYNLTANREHYRMVAAGR
jgi:hypothetical protein